MNGLFIVFAGSRLGITSEIDADQLGICTAPDHLPFIPSHEAHPGGNQAYYSRTGGRNDQVLLGFEGV
jgi:hypothetical protein